MRLCREDGSYLQTAGGGGGLLLEHRDASTGRHARAYQHSPVVPFGDGTELCFSAGRISLRANEWFTLAQVVEVFTTYLDDAGFPDFVRWRELSDAFEPR
jgi:hypothetical protein